MQRQQKTSQRMTNQFLQQAPPESLATIALNQFIIKDSPARKTSMLFNTRNGRHVYS